MKTKKRMVKKPKFGRIWVARFLVSFCIALVLCIMGTYVAVYFYRNYTGMIKEATYDRAITRMENNYTEIYSLEDLSDESKLECWKTMAYWTCDIFLNASLETNAYTYNIYNADTQGLLIGDEKFSYIIFGKKEEKSRIYRCPLDVMQEMLWDYVDLQEKLDIADGKRDGGYGEDYPEMCILDVYLKDGSFVPGKVELRQWEGAYYAGEGQNYTIFKTYDYTPKDTSGYEHIEVDRDIYKLMGPLCMDGKKDEKAKTLLENYFEDEDFFANDIWDEDRGFLQYIFGGIDYVDTVTVVLDEEFPVKFVMATHYNMFEDYGNWIAFIYAAVFVAVILISLCISYYTYMVRRNHYEMDAYRRETTNAMAHDLKTPLTAISGYAENLRDKVHTEKMDYYTEAILENVQYMNEMVGNILDLAKVENTEQKLYRETIHLKELTEAVLKKYEVLIEESQVSVHIEGDSVIKADSSMMMQVIENLMGNAIKYSKADSEISIVFTDAYFEICNVMEVSPEIPVEELWKPFVKGDNSRNEKGSGIGLTIVKNITDLHGYTLMLQCDEDVFTAEICFKKRKHKKSKR